MRALVELTQFSDNFDQQALEHTLLEHARAQGRLSLSQLAAQVSEAPGVKTPPGPETTDSPAVRVAR
ncbi:MAG: hypothetical protein ACWGON_08240 [Gemmatimonadota bacterium]